MNVFVTDLTVEYVVTHVQRFSSGILIIFFEKLGLICHLLFNLFYLPYMFYHTHFTCSTIHVLPYTFSEMAYRNWNCKGVKLPSGCVVPGSRSFHTFGCCFVN